MGMSCCVIRSVHDGANIRLTSVCRVVRKECRRDQLGKERYSRCLGVPCCSDPGLVVKLVASVEGM